MRDLKTVLTDVLTIIPDNYRWKAIIKSDLEVWTRNYELMPDEMHYGLWKQCYDTLTVWLFENELGSTQPWTKHVRESFAGKPAKYLGDEYENRI